MEFKDHILAFDTVYTTNEIQIFKLALPLLSSSVQPYAAAFIKAKELKYCMDQLSGQKIKDFSLKLDELDTFLEQAIPYCSPKQKEFFTQIKKCKDGMKMFEKMKTMMDLFGEDFGGEGSDFSSIFQTMNLFAQNEDMESFGTTPMSQFFTKAAQQDENSLLNSILSEEQLQLFEKFKEQFET